MEYAIELLEKSMKSLERNIRQTDMLKMNMSQATIELIKVSELKKAIRILKLKNRKQ